MAQSVGDGAGEDGCGEELGEAHQDAGGVGLETRSVIVAGLGEGFGSLV